MRQFAAARLAARLNDRGDRLMPHHPALHEANDGPRLVEGHRVLLGLRWRQCPSAHGLRHQIALVWPIAQPSGSAAAASFRPAATADPARYLARVAFEGGSRSAG